MGFDRNYGYLNELVEPAIIQAVKNANSSLVDAEIGVGSGRFSYLVDNSRFLLKDKTIAWTKYDKSEIICATGPIDPQVGVLHVRDKKKKTIAVLANYSCHAVTGGRHGDGYGIDPSYPGICSEYVENKLGGTALFTAGASGNIHPMINFFIKGKQKQHQATHRMGNKLGKEIVNGISGINNYQKNVSVKSIKKDITLPVRKIFKGDELDIKRTMSRKQFEDSRRKGIETNFIKTKELLKKNKGKNIRSILQVLRIGDFALVGIPGQPFVEFGIEIKKRSPILFTFIASLANDGIGYLPTDMAYKLGGYQTWPVFNRLITDKGAGGIITEKSLKMIEKIY